MTFRRPHQRSVRLVPMNAGEIAVPALNAAHKVARRTAPTTDRAAKVQVLATHNHDEISLLAVSRAILKPHDRKTPPGRTLFPPMDQVEPP